MRRSRPLVSLFAAYALVLASVFGAVSTASLAGTSHIEICINSVQDGKPLPAHSGDTGLCCFIAHGASAALASAPGDFSAPVLFGSEPLPFLTAQNDFAATAFRKNPRAPPAQG